MVIDPYITRKGARPSPVKSGGWAGRDSISIIPYGSFDAATLREAVNIIQGSSPYYHFDEQGKLQLAANENEPVDEHYRRQRFRGQFIERMQSAGRFGEFIEEEREVRKGRVQQSEGNIEAATKAYYTLFEAIAPQFHGTHEDGTPYFDMPAFYQWENKQKRDPRSLLAAKEAVVRNEKEESAHDRQELREISGDQQIHQRDKTLLSDFRNFDALLERFRQALKEQNDSKAWNPRASEIAGDLSKRLHEVSLLFDDSSYHTACDRIHQAAIVESEPVDEKAKEEFTQRKATLSELFNWDGNRTADTLEVLRATVAILANTAGRQGINPINEAITLRVRAQESPMGHTMETLSARFSMSRDDEGNLARHDPIRFGMDDDIRRDWLQEMEGNIAQLRRLDAGAQKPETKNHHHNSYDDCDPEAEHYHNETRWDKRALLRHLMRDAESHLEEPADLMRFHNQFPQAINFIMASHEGEFLMHGDGRSRSIHDIPSFVNSYWMSMAGDAEISVSPELLAATRVLLKTQPLQALAAASMERSM